MTNQTPESVIAEVRHRRAYSVYGDGTAYLDIGRLLQALELVMAERDAALAAIERVRALETFSITDSYPAWTAVDHDDLLAALDGAPELAGLPVEGESK